MRASAGGRGEGRGARVSELEVELRLSHPGFALDVSVRLPGVGISVVLGPSGCGKTTLLRSLAGLERARGRVALGHDVWQEDAGPRRPVFLPAHRRPLGYVFQESSLFPHLSVRKNLSYGFRRVLPPQRRVNLDEAVQLLGIERLLERSPVHLSGGERQRVAIARALLTSPQMLLMDEPLSALDGPRKAEVLPYLERLSREAAIPVVYVTHDHDEALRLADHLVLMREGRVVASGSAADLLTSLEQPLSHLAEAGVLLHGIVTEHAPEYGQTRIEVGGQPLWVGLCEGAPGAAVRARVLARDVSVALSRPTDSSILNILPVCIEALRDDGPDTVNLQLRMNGFHADTTPGEAPLLLARLTRRSRDALQLAPGQLVYAQIKGVALMK